MKTSVPYAEYTWLQQNAHGNSLKNYTRDSRGCNTANVDAVIFSSRRRFAGNFTIEILAQSSPFVGSALIFSGRTIEWDYRLGPCHRTSETSPLVGPCQKLRPAPPASPAEQQCPWREIRSLGPYGPATMGRSGARFVLRLLQTPASLFIRDDLLEAKDFPIEFAHRIHLTGKQDHARHFHTEHLYLHVLQPMQHRLAETLSICVLFQVQIRTLLICSLQ